MRSRWNSRNLISAAALLCTVACVSGCVSLAANLIHAVRGNDMPAEFAGMEGKRVAVVCMTDAGLGNDATSSILRNNIQAGLSMNVEDIDLVRSREVDQWLDVHTMDESDYVEIGKGVKADLLLAVEVTNLRLKNGQTLFRGESDIAVTVYDIANEGRILFRKHFPEFAFPTTDGKPVSETTETKFRSFYLAIVSNKVAGMFYPRDATADYALDATMSSF